MPGFDSLQGLGQGAGIASGLAQGMQAFVNTRSALTDQEIKKRLANAQSTDAYAKLLQSGLFPDEADAKARQLGIVPYSQGEKPTGFVTPPMQAQQPSGIQEQPGSNAQNVMAPGAPPMDDSGKSPSGPMTEQQAKAQGMNFTGMRAFNASQVQKNADAQRAREDMLWSSKNDPAKVAAINNAQMEPTEKGVAGLQEYHKQAQVLSSQYQSAKSNLRDAGELSGPAAIEQLHRVMNPDIMRMASGGDVGQEKGIMNEWENRVSNAAGSGDSPESRANVEKVLDEAYRYQSKALRGTVNDISAPYIDRGASQKIKQLSALDESDALWKKGPSSGQSKSGESGPMTKALADATPSPADIMAALKKRGIDPNKVRPNPRPSGLMPNGLMNK